MTTFFETELKIVIPNKDDFLLHCKTPFELRQFMGRTSFKLKPANVRD